MVLIKCVDSLWKDGYYYYISELTASNRNTLGNSKNATTILNANS